MIVIFTFLDAPTFALSILLHLCQYSLLKMVPSKYPLPFKLFLGYKDYPTETNNVAKTEMPHQGTTQGNKSLCLVVDTVCF